MANVNYRQLAENIRAMQNPDDLSFSKALTEELASISYSDVLYYIRIAMNAVDDSYTQKSKDAGERVKSHLTSGGLKDVSFAYQGSVMTNTHIKGYSDIDLLAMSEKFYTRDLFEISSVLQSSEKKQRYYSSQINMLVTEQQLPPYTGSSLDDLRKLRSDSEAILKSVYLICNVDKPKSIKIKNTSLNREVDIVIANWYDDIRSVINGKGHNRGIQIYNKFSHQVGNADYPFLSIDRINEKSSKTGGRLKKMIRFLKNITAKSTLKIELNSFEYNAICYDIDTVRYSQLIYHELVYILYLQINSICSSQHISDNLLSVDESEYIFRGKPEKLESLKNLSTEVLSIYHDLKSIL